MIDETVVIQGHAIRFATVDLTATAAEIRSQLLCMSESTFRDDRLELVKLGLNSN